MITIKPHISLSNLSTMRTGGVAQYYCEVTSIDELKEAVEYAHDKSLPVVPLGGGSNVLIHDGIFPAVVVKLSNATHSFSKKSEDITNATFGGGMIWDEAVGLSVSENLAGIECLSSIPGTVGAAPVQNIGAYGQELSDTVLSLNAFDIQNGTMKRFTKDCCHFGYRDSIFKSSQYKGRYIIYEVTLALKNNGIPTLSYAALTDYLQSKNISNPAVQDVRDAVVAIRESKLENPLTMPNTGSFFKNPLIDTNIFETLHAKYPEMPFYEAGDKTKIPAAWLIENTGWKGKRLGKVGVSSKHALVLINPDGKGTAEDILTLRDAIIQDVKKKFEIILEPEVQFLSHT